jgi:hypothetical protein
MPKKPVNANLRKTLAGLLRAAAGGRADLAWLDKTVRKAGYVPPSEGLTRRDADAVRTAIVQALVDAETSAATPCCKESLHRVIEALKALAGGG